MAEPGDIDVDWVAPGAAAVEALRSAVAEAQGGDPLAPVTVVTPRPATAVAARRRLGAGGLAAVSFTSLDGLAERLAARSLAGSARRPLPPEGVVAAVRAELAADPGHFAAVVEHRGTQERLAALALELDAAGDGALPGDVPSLASDAQRVARGALRRLGPFAGTAETLAVAAKDVLDGTAPSTGPVVVFAPGRLTDAQSRLLRALAEQVALRVVALVVGEDDGTAALARSLGVQAPPGPGPSPPAPTGIVAAPDADEEVRSILRRLMRAADGGLPLHRMALLYGASEPYARLVAEQARAAGIPVRGPSVDTLAGTVVGRTLLGALAVVDDRWSRDSVIDLVASAPVVGPGGTLVSAARWDDLSRWAGVVGGLAQWDRRLAAERDRHLARLSDAAGTDEPADEEWADRQQRLADAAGDLRRFVLALADHLDRGQSLRSWAGVGPWIADLCDSLLGPVAGRYGWPAHEVDAAERIEQAARDLAGLDVLEPAPTFPVVRATIEAILAAPAPRRDPVAGGLLVGPLSAAVGLDLDVVAVVGVVEGVVPSLRQEDPILPDRARQHLGLPTADDRRAEQRRDFLLALSAAGSERWLSWPRGDQRSGRTQPPSRWLVDAAAQLAGRRPRVAELLAPGPRPEWPWFEVVPSFHGALLAGPTALDRAEADLAALAAARAAGEDVTRHPVAVDRVRAALLAARAQRRSPTFNRFHGDVGPTAGLPRGRPMSPTALERYAACPRRYFFEKVLELGETERPEGIDRVEARTAGSLAHDILEAFVGEAIGAGTVPPPGQPWSQQQLDRLKAIAERLFRQAEQQGKTGHPVRWEHDRRRILDDLERTLQVDADVRGEYGTTPVAVELAFGLDTEGAPAVAVQAGSREVLLRGRIDRVDHGPGHVRVIDYKTGSPGSQKAMTQDPFGRGQQLQLAVYALVGQQLDPAADVRVDYWYISARGGWRRVGFEFGPEHRQELAAIVERIVDGIEGGVFPAHPGEYQGYFKTWDQCGYCPFDRICPADRGLEWQQVHLDPRLRAYVEMAEGPLETGDGGDEEAR